MDLSDFQTGSSFYVALTLLKALSTHVNIVEDLKNQFTIQKGLWFGEAQKNKNNFMLAFSDSAGILRDSHYRELTRGVALGNIRIFCESPDFPLPTYGNAGIKYIAYDGKNDAHLNAITANIYIIRHELANITFGIGLALEKLPKNTGIKTDLLLSLTGAEHQALQLLQNTTYIGAINLDENKFSEYYQKADDAYFNLKELEKNNDPEIEKQIIQDINETYKYIKGLQTQYVYFIVPE